MPRGDRSGPMGEGPQTGRRMGHCNRNAFPSSGVSRGFRRGVRGGGRGRFAYTSGDQDQGSWPQDDRISQLEGQLEDLKDELAKLRRGK